MSSLQKKGLLLLNLGTPDGTEVSQVRRYLGEFLMDPYVIDIPWVWRFLLVHGIVLRTRPKKSAEAYESIWTDRGSPLKYYTEDLTLGVKKLLEATHVVKFAMRYAQPSIRSVLEEFKSESVSEICVIPLYPQYALASTESSIQKVKSEAQSVGLEAPLRFIRDFFDFPPFLQAIANNSQSILKSFKPDHVLFSFHGVPERHVKKTDLTGKHCLSSPDCCNAVTEKNRWCYRAQSYATARGLAQELGFGPEEYTVSFQSRLGRTPWIKPYTDFELVALAKLGIKRIAVFEPSFVADCLETLEEIGIRGKEDFIAAGGEDLVLIPSLNAEANWVQAVSKLATALDP